MATWEIADKYGVKSEDDVTDPEKRLRLLFIEISVVKSEIAIDQFKLKRVLNLMVIFEKIVEDNDIYNLIRTQRERDKSLNT